MLCGRILQHYHLGTSKSGWACIKFYKVWSVILLGRLQHCHCLIGFSSSQIELLNCFWSMRRTLYCFCPFNGESCFLSFLGPLKLEIAPKHYIEWLDWQMSKSQVENITCNINLYFFMKNPLAVIINKRWSRKLIWGFFSIFFSYHGMHLNLYAFQLFGFFMPNKSWKFIYDKRKLIMNNKLKYVH